jgi:hypothetical protein
VKPYLKNTLSALKRACGAAQIVDPEFKYQYGKKNYIFLDVSIVEFFLDISMHVKHFRKSNI